LTERIDLAALRAGLAALFPAADPMSAKVSELAGDASTRRYYRVRYAPGAPLPSVVVMRYPDEVSPEAELPFLNVHRYLTAAGVPVPIVYRFDPKANLLFLEDAGDTMLEDAVREHGARGCLPLYEQCVEILVRIQSGGTRALDGKAIPRASPSTSRNSPRRSTSSSGTPCGNTAGSDCPTGKSGRSGISSFRSSNSCPPSRGCSPTGITTAGT